MSADPQAGMEIDGTSANGDPSTGTKSASINMNTINSDINNDNESESDDRDSNLIDITDLINETCKSLTYANPLICKESFNLYDSMSALDLMEPKMDGCQIPIDYYTKGGTYTGRGTGIVTNGKKGDKTVYVPPRPIPKNISQSSLVWKLETNTNTNTIANTVTNETLSKNDNEDMNTNICRMTRQIRVILLEMLVRLESFLSGNSVAESIYTCIYTHDDIIDDMLEQISKSNQVALETETEIDLEEKIDVDVEVDPRVLILQKTLFVATILLLKVSKTISNVVKRGDIYEEEDFTFVTSSMCDVNPFRFYPSYDDETEKEQLSNDLEGIKAMLKKQFCGQQGSVAGSGSSSKDDNDNDDDHNDDVHVILHVLDYMNNLREACLTLSEPTKDDAAAVSSSLQNTIHNNHAQMQQFINAHLHGDNPSMKYTPHDHQTIFRTFDPYINRHLLGNTPVRKVVLSSPAVAMQNLIRIYHEMGFAVCNILTRGNTLARVRRILSRLSNPSIAMPIPNINTCADIAIATGTTKEVLALNILTRSLIIINLYFDDRLLGQYPLPVLIAKDMQEQATPEILFTSANSEYGAHFLNRLCKPIYDTLKLYALNRNRQRAYLDSMFRDWKRLQNDASTVDMCFQKEFELDARTTLPYVSNYVLGITVGLMDHYVALGVEVGLFHGHYHLMTAFWYRDFLLSAKLNVKSGVRENLKQRKAVELQILQEEQEAAEVASSKTTGGGGKVAKGKKKGKKGGKGKNSGSKSKVASKKKSEINLDSGAGIQKPEDDEDASEFLLLSTERTLCRGIVRVS